MQMLNNTVRKSQILSPSVANMPDLAEFMTTEDAAEKLGFTSVYISKFNKLPKHKSNITIVEVSKLEEMLNYLFG